MMQDALAKRRTMRVAYVDISPELLLQLMSVPKEGLNVDYRLIRCERDRIPDDAKALRCGITENGNVRLQFESSELPEVHEGEQLPQYEPVYTAIEV